jgi:hypothetical protein
MVKRTYCSPFVNSGIVEEVGYRVEGAGCRVKTIYS